MFALEFTRSNTVPWAADAPVAGASAPLGIARPSTPPRYRVGPRRAAAWRGATSAAPPRGLGAGGVEGCGGRNVVVEQNLSL